MFDNGVRFRGISDWEVLGEGLLISQRKAFWVPLKCNSGKQRKLFCNLLDKVINFAS